MKPRQVAARLFGHLPHADIGPPNAVQGEQIGIPAVAGDSRPPHRRVAPSRHPNGRVGLLRRLGKQRNVLKVEKPSVMGNFVLRPQPLHRLQHLVGAPSPGVDRNLQGVKLRPGVPLPADANAKIQPPAGDLVQAGHQLGQHHGMIQRRDDNACQHAQAGGSPGGRRHCGNAHQRRPGRFAVHHVLAHGNPVKPQTFRAAGKLGHIPIIFHAQIAAEGNRILCHRQTPLALPNPAGAGSV